MSKTFLITEKNVEAIDRAIHAIRDRIQAGESRTEESRQEDREVLAELLCIYPVMAPTWNDGRVS